MEVVANRGRGADEGNAHRLRPALERNGWATEAVVVGRETARARRVGQEAVGRSLFAGWRVVDKEVARRATEIAMPAGIADEFGVPGLEHVIAPRAFGDAAFLDLAHQLAPFR